MGDFWLRVLWHGGSTLDAWLNISSAKMASRILTMPQSTTQMGLPSAIVFQLFQGAIGLWIQCIINQLYLKHRVTASRDDSRGFTMQLHEVIGGLLGSRWRAISLLFNFTSTFYVSSLQLVACSNIVYLLNDKLDKRTWTCVFSAIFSLSIFMPSAHNYRVWSFLGVITTSFVSGYLAVAPLLHGKVADVEHSSPRSYQEFFSGLSGSTIVGHLVVPVEIMDAMWKPAEFKVVSAYATVYILLVTMVPSISMNRRFGDKLLPQPNALVLLPDSKFRDSAVVLLLVHLFINFGMYSLAVYAMWEKLLRVDDSWSYARRMASRLPVLLALCVVALAFPFYGIISKMFDSTLVAWNLYIIPCAAYIALFWSADEQQRSKPFTRLGWAVDLSVNLGLILWVLIVEFGLALWGNIAFINLAGVHLFAKCYHCKH